MNNLKRIFNLPLHPFFTAGYAVLFLLGYNLHEITPASTLRSLLLSLLGAAILLLGSGGCSAAVGRRPLC